MFRPECIKDEIAGDYRKQSEDQPNDQQQSGYCTYILFQFVGLVLEFKEVHADAGIHRKVYNDLYEEGNDDIKGK